MTVRRNENRTSDASKSYVRKRRELAGVVAVVEMRRQCGLDFDSGPNIKERARIYC